MKDSNYEMARKVNSRFTGLNPNQLMGERHPLLGTDEGDSTKGAGSKVKYLVDGRVRNYLEDECEDSESIISYMTNRNDTKYGAGESDQLWRQTPNSSILGGLEAGELTEKSPGFREVLPYYLPILSWLNEYSFQYFVGDFVGGVSLIFYQLPLSLSYSASLAHVPVLCGLNSLAIAPLVYLVLGSVPQMIVGPEAAILLAVGQAIEPLLHHYRKRGIDSVELVAVITFISGATLLGFGLGRLGYLDNILCASLLKGFIFSVGVVMIINSLVSMMGLSELLKRINDDSEQIDIHTPLEKVMFLFKQYHHSHPLTIQISFFALAIILGVRMIKSYINRRELRFLKLTMLVPEILIVVTGSMILCSRYGWANKGIDIMGPISSNHGENLMYNPFKSIKLMRELWSVALLCAMLGFFESNTALKSLGSSYTLPISTNRELVALGSINMLGSLFGALPAFGGYGRSKMNALSAKTTMLGAIMGICTIFVIFKLLDKFYFVPNCILSVVTAVIGLLLVDEAPYDLYFHWQSKGYSEMITFCMVVIATLVFSMQAGIMVGLGYLLIRVIRNSVKSRIQILGRISGTNTFADVDLTLSGIGKHEASLSRSHDSLPLNIFTDENITCLNYKIIDEVEECLIVKVPEPLTFTNSADLQCRLQRFQLFGSTKAHPGGRRRENTHLSKHVVFDLGGMLAIDSTAAQVLKNLLKYYYQNEVMVFFVRVNRYPELRRRLKDTGITKILLDNLDRLVPAESSPGCLSRRNQEIRNLLYDLMEGPEAPFFEHVVDVLKIIDGYENDSVP